MDNLSLKGRQMGERLTENVNVLSWDCGTSNLAYCLIEYVNEPDREFSIRLWENFNLGSDTAKEHVEALIKELDARPWMVHADHVCIEAQVMKNTMMKVVCHTIQAYFICRSTGPLQHTRISSGEVTKQTRKGSVVHFISAKNKFKVCNVPAPEGMKPGHSKNKKIAILMAEKILSSQKDKSMLAYLDSFKKRDDLSDSFLQGLYFLRLIQQKTRASKKILDHINGTTELKIIDESDTTDEVPIHKVYRSENYSFPEFDIDGNTLGTAETWKKKSLYKIHD